MNCRKTTMLLADYLSGSLAPSEQELVREHLHACPDCRRYLASYRETIRLARESGGPRRAENESAPEGLVHAILENWRNRFLVTSAV